MKTFSDYIKTFFLSLFLFLLFFSGFNWIVDPFNLNGFFRADGFNAALGKSFNTPMLTKAYVIRRLKPKSIVLGSSRTDHALTMAHPGWKGAEPGYNLSIERADINELMRFFERAQSVQPLKKVVLGLDFFMFNKHEGHPEGYDDNILGDSSSSHFYQALWRHLQILLSIDTYLASQYTILNQTKMDKYYDYDGHRTDLSYNKLLRNAGGYHARFSQYLKNHNNNYQQSFDFKDTSLNSPLNSFRRIVQIARQGNIDLKIFISPTHALDQEIWRTSGKWPDLEQWKRELVYILAEDAALHPNSPIIPLWDFSGYNAITTEAVPVSDNGNPLMHWYWEPSHYKEAVGNIILDNIFEYHQENSVLPKNFGIKLNTDNIETHLAKIRIDQSSYRLTNLISP